MVHLSFELLLYRPKQYIANMLDIFPILCQNTIRFCSATHAILVCATEHPHTAVFIAPYYAYTVHIQYPPPKKLRPSVCLLLCHRSHHFVFHYWYPASQFLILNLFKTAYSIILFVLRLLTYPNNQSIILNCKKIT